MKNKILIKLILGISFFLILSTKWILAQETVKNNNNKFYSSSGGEMIFSWAEATKEGLDATAVVRFSLVVNIQYQLHRDLGDNFGFFSGINIRNVGFIYKDPTTVNTKYKERAYTLGIPVALKIGQMKGLNLFGGYEIEFPFNFKEKKFVNEDKVSKVSSWFSDKTPDFYQSFFFGIQTKYGTQIKFKYYMTNFLNKDYSANDGSGNIIYPYKNLDANVMYISLSLQILKGKHYNFSSK